MNEMPPKYRTVMVIDDNNIDLYITARMVRKNNFAGEVLEFSSGKGAFQYLTENKNNPGMIPEVIFVDIHMPQMSGFEFMEAFDSLPEDLKKHCRCYIISSTIDEKDIQRANSDKNVVAFQEKPVNNTFFENILRN